MTNPRIPEDILQLSRERASKFYAISNRSLPADREIGQVWSTRASFELADGILFQTDEPRMIVILEVKADIYDKGDQVVAAPLSLRTEMASEWDLLVSEDVSLLGFDAMMEVWNQTPVLV